VRQIEAALDQLSDDSSLCLVEVVVAIRRLDQQCGKGKLKLILATYLPPAIRSTAADPFSDATDHCSA
jgi:hypothetical protein